MKQKRARKDDSPDAAIVNSAKLNNHLSKSSAKKTEIKKPKPIKSPKAVEEPVNLESPTSVTMK